LTLNLLNQSHQTTCTPETGDTLNRDHQFAVGARHDVSLLSFWGAWPWWLIPATLSLVLILLFVDPFIGDWDGLEYTMLSVRGYPSSMALGRSLFILFNHALYFLAHSLFNVAPDRAYLIFKYAVVIQGPLAVIACWILARNLSRSVHSATIAALLVTFSPVFVLYGGQVMTDVPSVLIVTGALIIHLHGVQRRRLWMVMLGAALLGAGVNVRETAGFYAPWLVAAPLVCGWRHRRELFYVAVSCLVFLTFALGGFAYWFFTDSYFRAIWFGWRQSMSEEAARHPLLLKNLLPFATYLLVTAPLILVTLPFASWKEWRERGMSPMLLLAMVGLFTDLLLFFNYSTAVNWRYFLTGLPALAPLCADYLMRTLSARLRSARAAFALGAAIIVGGALLFAIYMRPASRDFIQRRALSKGYREQLAKLPRDAVMLAGSQTVAVKYWRGIGEGEWDIIGTGAGWPGDGLVLLIEDYLAAGRRVFIDVNPVWWLPCAWQGEEIRSISDLEDHFRFRRITNTIFEIRPLSDNTAGDEPNLKGLLPENRSEDVKKCLSGRA
jgi:dolichyl-phosphate-mannose-protein mannosyltransferase